MSRCLALHVALRDPDDYPSGTCVAWMDSAGRVCAKAAEDYLCTRHVKVAQRKQAGEAERIARRDERAATLAAMRRPRLAAELDRIELRLAAIDPDRSGPGRLDHGELNTPLRQRIPSPERVHELAELHTRRADLRRQLGME